MKNRRKIGVLPPEIAAIAVDARVCKDHVLPPLTAFNTPIPASRSIAIPFNLDAEFVDNLTSTGPFDSTSMTPRQGVTVQIRGVTESTGHIFAHPDLADFARDTGRTLRHPVASNPCVLADWLCKLGVDAEIFPDESQYKNTKRSCRMVMCAHFAIADVLYLAGTSDFLETLISLYKSHKLAMGRRLVAKSSAHKSARGSVCGLSPWLVRIDTVLYRLSLEIVDTAGLHGNASYAELAKNVGIVLDSKGLISRTGVDADIKRMHEVYFEKPVEFDAYALGDLYVSDIVYKNHELWKEIWGALDIGESYTGPKLTVGASVADILKNRIAHVLNCECTDELLERCTGNHNAANLSKLARDKNPMALLAKVDGGRCRNAKPTFTALPVGAYADIDKAGAYASAMTVTPLVLGQMRGVAYGNARDTNPDLGPCPTLAEFLRTHEHAMVDRAWIARISTRAPLSFESDLIASWVDYSVTVGESDSEIAGLDILMDTTTGGMRHFTREIHSGTLTSDLLDVARNTMSPNRFREFADKCVVRAALYVNQADYISLQEFGARYKAGTLNKHDWTCITLGDLVSDIALANRKQHAKISPLNILFKLVSNTTYGDAVSRHFASSSVVAGSNVTATVRAGMYMSEKALNLVGTITDGQLFDLERVLFAKKDKRNRNNRPSDMSMETRAYRASIRELKNDGLACLRPLSGDKIDMFWNGVDVELRVHRGKECEVIVGESNIKTWIDNKAIEHLQTTWPRVKLLNDDFRVVRGLKSDKTVDYVMQKGLFRFETKAVVSRAALHGSANYWHIPADGNKPPELPKMRSFEGNREHWAFTAIDGELTPLDTYTNDSPALVMMRAILDNSHAVPILPPFVKTRILKPGVYQPKPIKKWIGSRLKRVAISSRYVDSILTPGDSIFVMGRPRLFSFTQFTFQTRAQSEGWKKACNRLINRDGIAFEQWFVNRDSTIDYAGMCAAIDDAIVRGVTNPIAHFDETRIRALPAIAVNYANGIALMREHLNSRLGAEEMHYETIAADFD